MVLISGLCSHT